MPDILLPIIFTLLLIFYIHFLFGIYTGLRKHSTNGNKKLPGEFTSVLIPFRNESDNILLSLASIENQNYPKNKFEVIYINDSSKDDSLKKICNAEKSFNIKVISLPEDFLPNAHKKRAVRYGIENCKGDIVVTTDADCIHRKEWLETLLRYYDNETGFISGPVEFEYGKSLFEKVQRIEFAGLILAGAGLIGINKPAICNAANASYRKAAYKSVKGFDDNLNLSSGDDEILMQKIWKQGNYKIKFCMNRDAVVTSLPNKTFNEFYHQRKRWASKGLFYTNRFLILKLFLIFIFYFSLVVQLLLGIFYSAVFLISFSISFIMKMVFEYLILKKGVKLLFNKKLLEIFILTEFIHIPYIIFFSIAGTFGNYKWKERKIKR